jgi:hypothetical protein
MTERAPFLVRRQASLVNSSQPAKVRPHGSSMELRQSHWRRAATAALLLQMGSTLGCSFLFVSKPPKNRRDLSSFNCSSGRGWPVTDSVFAGTLAMSAAVGAATDEQTQADGTQKPVSVQRRVEIAALLGAIALLEGGAALYGFTAVGECRDAQSELQARTTLNPSARPDALATSAWQPASLPPTSAPVARVYVRGGQVVEGKILGTVLLEPEREVSKGIHTLVSTMVNGPEVISMDARGLRLRESPKPTIGVLIAVDEVRAPEWTEVLGSWVRHPGETLIRTPSGTLIRAGASDKPLPHLAVRGELLSKEEGSVAVSDTIRVETSKGIVNISVSDLGDENQRSASMPSGVAPAVPALPSSSAQRAVSAGPPPATDWSTTYVGRGALTVTIRNSSDIPIFVKVRDGSAVTVAQVPVAANSGGTIHLGNGNFEVLMKARLGGRDRYFKGPAMPISPGTTGEAILTVGVPAAGDSLQEVDSDEFNR